MLALIGLGVLVWCVLSLLALPVKIALHRKMMNEELRRQVLADRERGIW